MTAFTQKPPQQGPWVDIDLGALCANYATIRDFANRSNPVVETAAVVKCDAYGLGMEPVARALADRERCRSFFVVYPEEGAALRAALDHLQGDDAAQIFAFAGPSAETISLFHNANIIPVLNSLEQARLWQTQAAGRRAALHIDTGMNRLGAPMSDAREIAALDDLNITLIMSHLACASDPAHPKNQQQRRDFMECADLFPGAQLSLSASGGALIGNDYHFDITRPGIALFGGSPFETTDERIKPVVALRAPIVQLRSLKTGESVGYGATFTASKPTVIATAALGYGDGYPRAEGSPRHAIIHGESAPIAGRISMDFITLDVTDLTAKPSVGDTAEFFGPSLSIDDVARSSNRSPYDLLTGLGARVNRRYL